MIIVKKIGNTITKTLFRPLYGRLCYPHCKALLCHRLLINKKCLNVRQKLGTRTLSLTLSLPHSLTFTLSLFHSFTLLFTHSRHAEQLLFYVYAQKSLSHFRTLSLSHSLTLALSHSRTLSFTLSRHAEQLLFSCPGSKFTLSLSHSHTLSFSHSLSLDMLNKFCNV